MRIKLLISAFFICICSIYAKNSALVIGIGNYNTEATGWLVIHGNNDVDYLERKLRKKGFSVITLTDRLATKSNIKDALNNLVVSTASGDTVYVHFSGHGQRIKDVHGQEKDGYNESFICYDAYKHPNFKVGYRGENHFIDDELFQFINQKNPFTFRRLLVLIIEPRYWGGTKNLITMTTIVTIIYLFMCFISNWNLLWPVKMIVDGGLGDKAIAIVWCIMFFTCL